MALLGLNAKLYRLTTGTRATWGAAVSGFHTGTAPANLSEVKNVRDLSLNLETAKADVTTRGSNGFKQQANTITDGSVEFEAVFDDSDSDLAAFISAWSTRASIACAILSGDKATSGVTGLWADFNVDFSKDENLEDAQKLKIKLVPAASGATGVAPEWIKVS